MRGAQSGAASGWGSASAVTQGAGGGGAGGGGDGAALRRGAAGAQRGRAAAAAAPPRRPPPPRLPGMEAPPAAGEPPAWAAEALAEPELGSDELEAAAGGALDRVLLESVCQQQGWLRVYGTGGTGLGRGGTGGRDGSGAEGTYRRAQLFLQFFIFLIYFLIN